MDFLDSIRTTIALMVGYFVAIFGIELLPLLSTGTVVIPASIGLATGVLATLGCRRLLGTTNYATLTGAVFFMVVGAALVVQGSEGPVATEHARLVLAIGVAGVVVNEVLVNTGELITAGGIERTDRHRLWAVPAAIVGVFVLVGRQLDFDGDGPLLAWSAVVLTLAGHVLVASTGAVALTTPVFALVACSLFVLFPVTSPQRLAHATGEGSVTGALWGVTKRTVERCLGLFDRGVAATRTLARRLRTVVTDFSVPDRSKRAAAASSGSTSSTGTKRTATAEPTEATTDTKATASTTNTGTTASTASTPSDRQTTAGTQQTHSGGPNRAASGGPTPQSAANETEQQITTTGQTDGGTCQNCGRRHDTVRKRSIVDATQATEPIELCACCHAARRCPDTERRRGGSVPVDRSRVVAASDGRCRACGSGPEHTLEPYPVVPLESRGHPHERNVVALCSTCHTGAREREQ